MSHATMRLLKGDQTRIAEASGATRSYVKQVLLHRPKAKSPLAKRIRAVANQLLHDRDKLAQPANIGKRDVLGNSVPDSLKDPIEEFGYDYFDVGWPDEIPPKGSGTAIDQLYYHLHYAMTEHRALAKRVEAMENSRNEATAQHIADAERIEQLKADLLAANNETARLEGLLSIIRKATKLAKA